MSETGEPFKLLITGPAARALAGRPPEKIAAAVHEFITTTLLNNPHRLGKRLLLPPYEGTWSARRGSYRVLYEIDEENRTVTVTAVEHRSDAYRSR
ncbi:MULTISPECIES: type II toxin-antitoxin system RelE/ParE family toxin [Protofrankia]|uniref:Plasmid stabilization protein n=1 Tax=Protofrankia coriariae TaxID=1562887 RepID=A0ABR5F6Y3_9ACTN|nr:MULTISPECIES: type II toxin-antitoxin system RelE/ParE family toxin [Protofrankia]KLL12469.1 plasmid stabilization protein [Protofrankia coriariae]ONH35539.1 plasmid stabilization protein [Protofrankia sp. BMG5.30]